MIFIKSPITKEHPGDLPGKILKKYLKGKRYNYNQSIFIDVRKGGFIADLLQDDYNKVIRYIGQTYTKNDASLLKPSLTYSYNICHPIYENHIEFEFDEQDFILTRTRNQFTPIFNTLSRMFDSMKLETWFDYRTDILENYKELLLDINNNNKYNKVFLIANRIFITHYFNNIQVLSNHMCYQ